MTKIPLPIKIGKKLGSGAQGNVFSCEYKEKSGKLAVKIIPINKLTEKRYARFDQEINALKLLEKAKYIIKMKEVFTSSYKGKDQKFIVMEKCDKNLFSYLRSNPSLSIHEKFYLFKEIICGIEEAHNLSDHPIIHRDLKPRNILLSHDHIKIADFGICFELSEEEKTRITGNIEKVGAWGFIAPEQLWGKNEKITPSIDFYSLGKIFYYLITHGRILPGELFTDEKYSLASFTGNPKFEIFDEFFSHTINSDPDKRYQNISELKQEFLELTQKFFGNIQKHSDLSVDQKKMD